MAKEKNQTEVGTSCYWRYAVRYREGFINAEANGLKADIEDLGVPGVKEVWVAAIYYCGGSLRPDEIKKIGEKLLIDPITQEYEVRGLSSADKRPAGPAVHTVEVAYHPGVRDPVEDSLKKGAADLGVTHIHLVRTAKEYTFTGTLDGSDLDRICDKLLVNATIQQIVTPENLGQLLNPSQVAPVPIETVHLLQASDTVLQRISLDHQLSLNLEEMKAIQVYFRQEGREPALIELETVAQTWSEHCKHKTLRGQIVYTEEVSGRQTKRVIDNLLKETIMKATQELNLPWCISVFEDNSGVIAFDEEFHVCFKVETHNHPSALEPFGGASTGIGGVIRDILGTGLGAKPIASTDVFCFAPPDTPAAQVPPGVLHPRRVIKGVVAGVQETDLTNDDGALAGIVHVDLGALHDLRTQGAVGAAHPEGASAGFALVLDHGADAQRAVQRFSRIGRFCRPGGRIRRGRAHRLGRDGA